MLGEATEAVIIVASLRFTRPLRHTITGPIHAVAKTYLLMDHGTCPQVPEMLD